jgi:hypothetical protein
MSDYIATDYDNLMQDECSHVFPNIHSEESQEEVDPSAHWNEDDNETPVHSADWLFIGYRKTGLTRTKFVLQQENFLSMIEEFGPSSLLMNELKIVSGEDWLDQRLEEFK